MLGDYVTFVHRGLVSGLIGFAAGLGALFALGVYLNVRAQFIERCVVSNISEILL